MYIPTQSNPKAVTTSSLATMETIEKMAMKRRNAKTRGRAQKDWVLFLFILILSGLNTPLISPPPTIGNDEGWAQHMPAVSSFQVISDALPTTVVDGIEFPRGKASRSYMGVGAWNSRYSLPKALVAMLGSQTAFIETPFFTVCRLQLQYGTDRHGFEEALQLVLFRSNDLRRETGDYFRFVQGFESEINCTPKDGRKLDEEMASKVARTIIDEKLVREIKSRLKEPGHYFSTKNVPTLNSSNILWTSTRAYIAAQHYGPSTVVMISDGRELDLAYYKAIKRRPASGPITSCRDFLNNEEVPDESELITPGYKTPDSVAGFEIRIKQAVSDYREDLTRNMPDSHTGGQRVPSISHAFYKESLPQGTAVFLLRFKPGSVNCVMPSSKLNSWGSFFECNSEKTIPKKGRCTIDKDVADYTRPLRTSGFIFDEDFRGGCDAAKLALENLLPEHQDFEGNTQYLFSQIFQNVISTASTKLRKILFIVHFTSQKGEIKCHEVVTPGEANLWRAHQEIASAHIGLDTQYSTCVAQIPRSWSDNGGVHWDATLLSQTHASPFEYDAFRKKISSSHPSSGSPNWSILLGRDGGAREDSCYGFKGSLCEVKLVSDPPTISSPVICELECTYSGAWFARLDSPFKCHCFAENITSVTPKARGHDKYSHINSRAGKDLRNGAEVRHLSQSELDPLHWPKEHKSSLNIVMSSDLHGYILGHCSNSYCSSGLLSMASVVNTIRHSSSITRSPMLLLDAGDALFGSGTPPEDIMKALDILGYDALALGNHDLDIGVAALQRLVKEAKFPIIAANVEVDGSPFLSKALVKDAIIGQVPYRICVIGLSTPEPNPLAGSNLAFIGAGRDEGILEETRAIQHQFKCDIQILLSHLGLKKDEAIAIASKLRGKNEYPAIILGGHSHVVLASEQSVISTKVEDVDDTFLDRPFPYFASGVPIAHAGSNGMYAGILSVEPITSSARFSVKGALQPLGREHGIFPDANIALPQAPKLTERKSIQIETHPGPFPICSTRCRREECLAGNLVANAMRECVFDAECGGHRHTQYPLIALLESGTLRSCLRIDDDDFSTMLPWPNRLVVVTVKGSVLRAMVEHGLTTKEDFQGGGFLQTSALQYKYRGKRILGIWQLDSPQRHSTHETSEHLVVFHAGISQDKGSNKQVLRDSSLYDIVVTDWLASGGDGFGQVLDEYVDNMTYTNATLQSALQYYTSKRPIIQAEMRSWDTDTKPRSGSQPIVGSMLRSLSAFIGSLAASMLSFPLYSLSVRRATALRKSPSTSLMSGAWLAATAGALSNSIYFLFYYAFIFKHTLVRALFAAILNVIMTNPIWVVVIRLQTSQFKSSLRATAKKIRRNRGLIGFFDGLTWNLVLVVYPAIRQVALDLLRSWPVLSFGQHTAEAFRGAAASCLATAVTYPIQRWRVQKQAGVLECRFGAGLFDGLLFKLLHSGLAGFILFAAISGSDGLLDVVVGR